MLSREELHARCVEELGLDPAATDLTSREAVAALLRHAASFLCPCGARDIARAVRDSLRGIVDDPDEIREVIEEVLEALISYGDLVEQIPLDSDPNEAGTLIFLGPPSYVLRQSGAALLFGVVADGVSLLPDEYTAQIEYSNHLRRLATTSALGVDEILGPSGFIKVPIETWIKTPPKESPAECLSRHEALLDAADASGEIPGLTILDPSRNVTYYPGRWVAPGDCTGRYLGRRPRRYGSDMWCWVELVNGEPTRLVDLPLAGSVLRGCDEAWRLQAAIDASRGTPQRFAVRKATDDSSVLDLFSPIPAWARRRWDALGEPVVPHKCLLSYKFVDGELEEEIAFAHDWLWLTSTTS